MVLVWARTLPDLVFSVLKERGTNFLRGAYLPVAPGTAARWGALSALLGGSLGVATLRRGGAVEGQAFRVVAMIVGLAGCGEARRVGSDYVAEASAQAEDLQRLREWSGDIDRRAGGQAHEGRRAMARYGRRRALLRGTRRRVEGRACAITLRRGPRGLFYVSAGTGPAKAESWNLLAVGDAPGAVMDSVRPLTFSRTWYHSVLRDESADCAVSRPVVLVSGLSGRVAPRMRIDSSHTLGDLDFR